MINWGEVAAFTGPLIAAIGLIAGWFAWLGKKRDQRVAEQIKGVTDRLDFRITQVEKTLTQTQEHLDRQDTALATQGQAIARIEGSMATLRLIQAPPA